MARTLLLADGGSGAGLEKHNDSGRFDVHLSEASGFNTPKKLQQQQPPTGDDEALIRGSEAWTDIHSQSYKSLPCCI